jgi:copper transporter 1
MHKAASESGEIGEDESSSLLRTGSRRQAAERSSEIVKAALYAVQVFYSFFIM